MVRDLLLKKRRMNIPSTKDPIVQTVINKFQERSDVGIKKYNTTLEQNNANTYDWLNHLQEELMDATLYIQKLKTKIEELNKLDLEFCDKFKDDE